MATKATLIRLSGIFLALITGLILLVTVNIMAARAGADLRAASLSSTNDSNFKEKIIVVNNDTGTINIIDTATDIVYGPFLSGTLGSLGGGLFDVAVTPDGMTALISNFGDSAVYFVNVSSPLHPSTGISLTLPMFAEDIAITPNGRYALVTDGGFSNIIATIDIHMQSLIYTYTLPANKYAQAVSIAPDGTVITADYFGSALHVLTIDATGALSYTGSYSYTIGYTGIVTPTSFVPSSADRVELPSHALPGGAPETGSMVTQANQPVFGSSTPYMRPVNLAIAPDGQTVITCNVAPYTSTDEYAFYHVGVYKITSPGILSFSKAITELNRGTQSIAFSADGNYAYLNSNGGNTDDMTNDQMSLLRIISPGNAELVMNGAADYPRYTGSQLFGVDTIAVANGKAYIGFPTVSGGNQDLRIVDLLNFGVYKRTVDGIPISIGVIPVRKIYIPSLLK